MQKQSGCGFKINRLKKCHWLNKTPWFNVKWPAICRESLRQVDRSIPVIVSVDLCARLVDVNQSRLFTIHYSLCVEGLWLFILHSPLALSPSSRPRHGYLEGVEWLGVEYVFLRSYEIGKWSPGELQVMGTYWYVRSPQRITYIS